jgi:hypothetical protein
MRRNDALKKTGRIGGSDARRNGEGWDDGSESHMERHCLERGLAFKPDAIDQGNRIRRALVPAVKYLVARRTGAPQWALVLPPFTELSGDAGAGLSVAFPASD